MLQTRRINADDFEVLQSYYAQYEGWETPPVEFFPDTGLVVFKEDKIICGGYLYFTNSPMAIIEFVVCDKEYREGDRDEAIKLLIQSLSDAAKKAGSKFVWAWLQHEKLVEKYESVGFIADKNNKSTELIKVL